ncbi:MAG: tetratricopeptide repeat protein [Synergistales bacterium]|nr:tetratricopeptide repeat protein [Synergistales bacterium]
MRAYTQALDSNGRFVPALDALADTLLPREPVEQVREFFGRHADLRHEDTLAALAAAFARNGKYQEALEYLDEGLVKSPTSPRLTLHKGVVLLFLNRYEEALELFGRIPGHSRFATAARANLAFAHYLLGNLAEAQDTLAALDGMPETPELAVVGALVLLEAGNPPATVLARLLENNLPETGTHVLRLLGQLVRLGEYEKFERALPLLQVFPENERSLHLGKLYFNHGFHDLAAEELLRAVKQDNADAECMSMLGDICMNRELYEDAEVFYRAALVKDSRRMRHYTALTTSLVRQKKYGEGVATLEEAIRRFPQSELLRATLQAVRAVAKN